MNHLDLVGYLLAVVVVLYLSYRYSEKQKE